MNKKVECHTKFLINLKKLWISVNKTYEKHVDNFTFIHINHGYKHETVDIHTVIKRFFASFPPFSNRKRYKLINFAGIGYNCG